METYDRIGTGYNNTRKADHRITDRIIALSGLNPDSIIADIGAGTGNYAFELALKGFRIFAIEPSDTMLGQGRNHKNITWIKGTAEAIPLDNDTCDGAMCILATHHFTSLSESFKEIKRILKPNGTCTILTFDPRLLSDDDWLKEYFRGFHRKDIDSVPGQRDLVELLENIFGSRAVTSSFPLPHDLADSFFRSAWRYPEKYLDENFRKGISVFAMAAQQEVHSAITELADDLHNGNWDRKYSYVRKLEEFSADYYFVTISNRSELT